MTTWLIAVLVAMASTLGGFVYGTHVGSEHTLAEQAKVEAVADKAAEKVADKAATAISGLKVIQSTVYQKATHEIKTVPVYADCKHTDGVFTLVNQALGGVPDTPPKSVVPADNPTPGKQLRSDNGKTDRLGVYLSRLPRSFGLGGTTK